MYNINNNFYRDDDWQSTSTPIVKTYDDENFLTEDNGEFGRKAKKHSKHPVLTFQLIVVLSLLLLFFVVKFFSESLYNTVISTYRKEISKSVIYNGDFESFDFSSIFATDDEA